MYCRNCGKEIEDSLTRCNYCDEKVITERLLRDRDSSILWGILAFAIPLIGMPIGIILFLVWKDKKPYSIKATLIGALLGIIFVILILILPTVEGIIALGKFLG